MSRSSLDEINAVYDKYSDTMYRIALSHLLNKEDAEDAVHDVFIKYMSGSFAFFSEEHEKAWFIRVTVNHCHDMARRRRLRSHAPLEEALEVFAEAGTSDTMREILTLEDIYKTPILLHYFEGYSVEETARILRISVSAVKMRLSRGRDKLKEKLSGEI